MNIVGGLVGGAFAVLLGWAFRNAGWLVLLYLSWSVVSRIDSDPAAVEAAKRNDTAIRHEERLVTATGVRMNPSSGLDTIEATIHNGSNGRIYRISLSCRYKSRDSDEIHRVSTSSINRYVSPGERVPMQFDLTNFWRPSYDQPIPSSFACMPVFSFDEVDLIRSGVVSARHRGEEMLSQIMGEVTCRAGGVVRMNRFPIVVSGTITNNTGSAIGKVVVLCKATASIYDQIETTSAHIPVYIANGETKTIEGVTGLVWSKDPKKGIWDIFCRVIDVRKPG